MCHLKQSDRKRITEGGISIEFENKFNILVKKLVNQGQVVSDQHVIVIFMATTSCLFTIMTLAYGLCLL